MSNPVKKLSLNRETVRVLAVRTSLRTGVGNSNQPLVTPACPTVEGCPIGQSLNVNCAGNNQNKQDKADLGNIKLGPDG